MSSYNIFEHIFYILINNDNTSSGKYPAIVKTTHFTGQGGLTVVASFSMITSSTSKRD